MTMIFVNEMFTKSIELINKINIIRYFYFEELILETNLTLTSNKFELNSSFSDSLKEFILNKINSVTLFLIIYFISNEIICNTHAK